MCGICGWVDFGRDLTAEAATLETMRDSLAHRGPDAAGSWLSPRAGLGHRRLAVIDLEGGRQPMIERDADRDLAVLVYSGEVYNFRELRAELRACGHRFTTASDTEVVLRGWRAWGEGVAQRLHGMYAFALWDALREELLIVRDRLGIKPVYYYPLPSGVLFGSEPKAILASGMVEPAVDATGLLELLSLVRTPGEAIFRGMRELRPGHVLSVRRGSVNERRYWSLGVRDHAGDLAATVRSTRELLEGAVASQLVADVPVCTLLSGGLDSSTVTGLAQRALSREGAGPVRSYAVDFAPSGGGFQADEMRSTPDAPYVHELAAHVGADHSDIVLDAAELLSGEAWTATLHARDLPPMGEMDTSLYLMCRAIRQRSTVALSGEGADEVFGGYRWFHDPEAVASPTFPWLAMAARLGRRGVFEPRPGGGLDVAAYQAERYAEALEEVPRLPGEEGVERRMREIGYLHLTRLLPNPLDRKDRMSMATGLEVRVPFCDHRLVEHVFNVPWAMKTFDGREKSLLRAAARDLLPPSVAERAKSPFPTVRDPVYHRRLSEAVAGLLAGGTAPVLDLLNTPTVKALAAMPPNGAQVVRMGLERVLRLNDWLETYRVRMAL
ncbi:MAG TPA: asparagine synthase (glutamine-hydrolyzing) [Actinomycetota bacterium]